VENNIKRAANWNKIILYFLSQSSQIGGNYIYIILSQSSQIGGNYLYIILSQSLANFRLFPPIIPKLLQLYFKYTIFCPNLAIVGDKAPTIDHKNIYY